MNLVSGHSVAVSWIGGHFRECEFACEFKQGFVKLAISKATANKSVLKRASDVLENGTLIHDTFVESNNS